MRQFLIPFIMILEVLIIIKVNTQKTQCQSYVQQLINDILDLKIYSIPLQSLQYSGITKNNPGQMQQCRKSNFSYFLVFIKNTTANQQSFSGLCMPKQCKADDIEIALDFLHVNVYEERQLINEDDRVALVGAVIIGAWVVLVVGWSLASYWNKPIVNQYLVGEKFQRPDRGDGDSSNSNDHPSVQTIRQSRDQSLNIFNYRQGYRKLFKISNSRTNILSLILFLCVLSHSTSTQYSYRQKIAQNTNQILTTLNSFWGIFICNNEIALQSIIFILGFRLSYALVDSKNKKLRIIGRRLFDHIFKKWLILISMSLLVYSFTYYCISRPLLILWNNSNCIDCKNYIWQIWFLFRNLQLDSKICLPWFSVLEAQLLLTIISAPLLIVYKTSKKTGYMFILLLIGASVVISSQILQTQHITFIPGKLMNSQNSYWIDYQGNTFVRMGAFYIGIFFGMFVNQSLQKGRLEGWERIVAGKIREIAVVEWLVTIIGLLIMTICYSLITMYLDIKHSNKKPYSYMLAVPLCFVFGLGLFILPSYIQGGSKITRLIKRSLGWTGWTHLDRISLTYFLLAPMIIGYSTYSTQNSIHYGVWTIFTYLLGDLFFTYLVSVLVTALFENQILPIVSWLQIKVLGKEVQYSDIIIVEE